MAKLLALGWRVDGWDLNPQNRRAVEAFREFQVDLESPLKFPPGSTNETYDAVFHLAAMSSGMAAANNPSKALSLNSVGTGNLLEFLLGGSPKTKAFVFTSTFNVYGQDHGSRILHERLCCNPNNSLGVSKYAAEGLVRALCGAAEIKWYIARLFNVYGPGQDLARSDLGMIAIFLGQAIRNGCLEVKGSLDRVRDFIYIDDVTDALIAMGSEGTASGTFNVCSEVGTTVRELINVLRSNLNQPLPVTEFPGTLGDSFKVVGSNELLAATFSIEPPVSLEGGIQKTISWARTLEI